MHSLPPATVTETFLSINDGDAFIGDFAAHTAIQEWVKKHGLDPRTVALGGPMIRDLERCRIIYVGRIVDEDDVFRGCWTTMYQQGETPPLPWPAELDRYRVDA